MSNGGKCVLGVRMTEGKVRGPKGHGMFWQKCVASREQAHASNNYFFGFFIL